jgi:hypothetical protein
LFTRIKNPSRRASFIVLALIVAVTLLFFWRITFSGMILARGDVYSYFYPLWDVRSAAFRVGHIPLWSPDIFMGVPLLSNSQLGTFYPPNWLVTPFDAPTAITISMLTHTVWAVLGAYLLTRRTLWLDRIPALLAGVLFGLGGYLGGQSEHINQLQALSWMPWLFLVASQQSTANSQPYRVLMLRGLLFGVCVALQLLAGHPQTVFITLVGIGVVGFAKAFRSRQSYAASRIWWRVSLDLKHLMYFFSLIAIGGLIGLVLASPQLIPTFELSGLGNRGGGLDPQKVLAFSFTPLLMGRGLLPSYEGLLFGEYIAYSGVIGLGLSIIGLLSRQSSAVSHQTNTNADHLNTHHSVFSTLPYILLVIVGFFFALGAFNPLNWLLAALPGFSLFRVPARWMALEALGVAALAGVGLQSLKYVRPRWWVLGLVIVVMLGLAAASTLASKQAVDVIGPAVPTVRSWIGWGIALVVLLLLLIGRERIGAGRVMGIIAVAGVVELFLASQIMPFNLTASKDVYSASRFTIRQMQVYDAEQTPPGRLLSISPLEFDPGDKEALNARYANLGMDALSTRIALVATKLREVIGPNLGMQWGVPSIDGFDGGLLPTRYYTAFSSLLLPEGSDPSTDGRLREMLALPECRGACIPEQRWLNITNTRYLITDKTADLVNDGVFYDTSLAYTLNPTEPITLTVDPAFTATAVDVLYSSTNCESSVNCVPLLDGQAPTSVEPLDVFTRARWDLPQVQLINQLVLSAKESVTLHAVTLVDTRAKVFQQMSLPPWKRVLSSDIKLYENRDVTPRAFFVADSNVQVAVDTASALTMMRQSAVSSSDQSLAYVIGDYHSEASSAQSPSDDAQVTITHYSAERIEIHVNTRGQAGLLVLSDAFYPGWTATVNGKLKPIYRTNVMFRGVAVPQGESTIIFEYHPWWWPVVPLVGLGAWLIVIGFGLGCLRKYHPLV